MPFMLLLALFVIVPIAEITLLIRVGGAIGPLNTIAFVFFTAVLGAYLVRQQGFATLAKLQDEANAGRVPALQIAEGVALLFAGAVLLTPGFITDAVGFLLLIPLVRQSVISWILRNGLKGPVQFHYSGSGTNGAGPDTTPPGPHIQPDVIEGEFSAPDDSK